MGESKSVFGENTINTNLHSIKNSNNPSNNNTISNNNQS